MDTIIGAQADENPTATPFWAGFVEQVARDGSVEALGLSTLICTYDPVNDLDWLDMD